MEEKGAIYREKNPDDGRGVLIKLTPFGIEKRDFAREHVLTFNKSIRENISEQKINHFFEVIDVINDLVSNKKIF